MTVQNVYALTFFKIEDVGTCVTAYDLYMFIIHHPNYRLNGNHLEPTTDGKSKYGTKFLAYLDSLVKKLGLVRLNGVATYYEIMNKDAKIVAELVHKSLLKSIEGNKEGHLVFPIQTVNTLLKHWLGIVCTEIPHNYKSFIIRKPDIKETYGYKVAFQMPLQSVEEPSKKSARKGSRKHEAYLWAKQNGIHISEKNCNKLLSYYNKISNGKEK